MILEIILELNLLKLLLSIFLLSAFIIFPNAVKAQSDTPQFPVYIVQSGDTLNVISLKFNVAAEDIIAVNNLSDPNLLQVNSQLVIPGIEGAAGILSFEPIKLGETPIQIARFYNIRLSTLYRLNRVTSPSEFFLGSNAILVNNDHEIQNKGMLSLLPSEPIFESAIINDFNPWEIVEENQISYIWEIIPGENFVAPVSMERTVNETLIFDKLPLTQGKTSSIIINQKNANAQATFDNMTINFYDLGDSSVAIFGPHALKEPGLYPFHLEYTKASGEKFIVDQLISLQSGFYPNDPALSVDPATMDSSLTQSEENQINEIISQRTNEKYWNGLFKIPVDEPVCIKSWFGNRRSYNGGPYDRFHAGVDYGVCANLNIYAPADGIVVFTGPLTVRGNATIIDHGLGVFSGFWHQSNIFVQVGNKVTAGDLIGEIGTTGRSTGPHLHWEVITNSIQVDPLDWLDIEFP